MQSVEKIIFESPLLQIGTFRCPPWHERFGTEGVIDSHLLVFPRTSVYITQIGRQSIVTDPSVVVFYNKGQAYYRDKLSERGDLCDWFSFQPEAIAAAMGVYDPSAYDRLERPFRFTHGPTDAASYLRQRLVVEHILTAAHPDPLFVEETMLAVLERVITNGYRVWERQRGNGRPHTVRSHIDLIHAAKELLATHFRQPLTLTQIAQSLFYSPYHLCRIFRQHTGMTIHAYLNQVRLRTSLEYVTQTNLSLTRIGHELGYSSHSHFTRAFRQVFGCAPSRLRQSTSAQYLREMSKILTV